MILNMIWLNRKQDLTFYAERYKKMHVVTLPFEWYCKGKIPGPRAINILIMLCLSSDPFLFLFHVKTQSPIYLNDDIPTAFIFPALFQLISLAFEHRAMDLVFYYINLKYNRDVRLAFEALKVWSILCISVFTAYMYHL